MKTTQLGELLTHDQLVKTTEILNTPQKDFYKIKSLKEYFGTIKDDLSKKGVLPEYLAYVVFYQYQKATQ